MYIYREISASKKIITCVLSIYLTLCHNFHFPILLSYFHENVKCMAAERFRALSRVKSCTQPTEFDPLALCVVPLTTTISDL